MSALAQFWPLADGWIAAAILPIAIAILLSGVDDLILDVLCLFHWLYSRVHGIPPGSRDAIPSNEMLRCQEQKGIAIFIPCWLEHAVIAGMVEHNIAAIDYQRAEFFIGAYPNDSDTLAAVRELETRFPNVHAAICPHDGPTSKADCLNWIFQRMLLFEEDHGHTFDVVLTHDAEDVMHPESLLYINHYAAAYDMVQIPVLPLPTPIFKVIHGIYCDEFSEFQIKDMRARQFMGSFLPSNGVGTGYTRAALEKLARAESNRIFEPACLTEDYENGMRLHLLHCRQIFIPLRRSAKGWLATREYFPDTRAGAIRQRTRWVTGIALQTWERHGWTGNLAQIYWFWRDRKGLFGNPVSLASNLIFLYGAADWGLAHATGQPWRLGALLPHPALLAATLGFLGERVAVRMACVGRIYGWPFALGVPVRSFFANYVNASSTSRAVFRYAQARLRHEPLVWVKTEHAYPSRTALSEHKRKLSEILVGAGYVGAEDMQMALACRAQGVRLGDHLMTLGLITIDELYEALSLQHSLPTGRLMPAEIPPKVARALPRQVVRDWKVLPFRLASGSMFLASPEIPTDELSQALRAFTRMSLRFWLVTPANFEELATALL